MTRDETWSGEKPFEMTGRHFELLFTQQPVDVSIWRGPEPLADERDVEAGYEFRVLEGDKPFDRVVVTTPAAERVKFVVTRGEARYKVRGAWYDRNPIAIARTYDGTVAPHAGTERWSYTVPTGKKFLLQLATAQTTRITAAAPAADASAQVKYQPNGGSEQLQIYTLSYDNTVGARVSEQLGTNAAMLAGDFMRGVTSDGSTGGTVKYLISIQGIEFNA